ncbi:MAG: phage portal protein [Anaerorhabdus sp.]|uniref:phage portal protein n=1 Tax=Anaerorhabdus sp. TaxID=1872524 RepID=UPI003A8C7853
MNYVMMANLINKELKNKTNGLVSSVLSDRMANQSELWTKLYEDNAPWIKGNVQSANLPASIASELARLVTLELKTEVTGSTRANVINEIYKKVISNLRVDTEYACAKGGLIFKPYVNGTDIHVQVIHANNFFPITFNSNNEMNSCVFVDRIFKGTLIYTRLEYHSFSNKELVVNNYAYLSSNDMSLGHEIALSSVEEWSMIEPYTVFKNVKKIPFGYFKIPIGNTLNSNSVIGSSVYSKAIQLIKEADKRYSQICWEYEAKEVAVHISEGALKYDKIYDKFMYPGGNERLYRTVMFDNGAKDKPYLDTYSPDIRDSSLFNGWNRQLRLIEFNCSLAYGTLSDNEVEAKTATEINTSKQRSYSFVSDIQMSLQKALEDLVDAIDFYMTIYRLSPLGDNKVSFKWDDSIVVDATTERMQDRLDVQMGTMSKVEYRMKWYGEDEATAKSKIDDNQQGLDGQFS